MISINVLVIKQAVVIREDIFKCTLWIYILLPTITGHYNRNTYVTIPGDEQFCKYLTILSGTNNHFTPILRILYVNPIFEH